MPDARPQLLTVAPPLALGLAAVAYFGLAVYGHWSAAPARGMAGVSPSEPPPISSATDARTEAPSQERRPAAGLFGQPDPAGRVPPDAAAAQTPVQLSLSGILRAPSGSGSRAILAVAGKPAALYREGDTVASGTTLERIETDRVWLKRNGNLESLTLPRATPGGAADSAVRGRLATSADRTSPRRRTDGSLER